MMCSIIIYNMLKLLSYIVPCISLVLFNVYKYFNFNIQLTSIFRQFKSTDIKLFSNCIIGSYITVHAVISCTPHIWQMYSCIYK